MERAWDGRKRTWGVTASLFLRAVSGSDGRCQTYSQQRVEQPFPGEHVWCLDPPEVRTAILHAYRSPLSLEGLGFLLGSRIQKNIKGKLNSKTHTFQGGVGDLGVKGPEFSPCRGKQECGR